MTTKSSSIYIAAPPEEVFEVVAHVENFAKAVPHITNIDYHTDQTRGVGTKFTETRQIRGREGKSDLEVTEYEPPNRVRIVSDAGGTIWDTVMTVVPEAEGSKLTMAMDARPHTFMARIMTPLIMRMVGSAVEDDMDAVKDYCEAQAG